MEHLTKPCVCGCGETAEYAARHVGGRSYMNQGITERHYRVEDRGYETPCWIWAGRSKRAYVQTTRGGRSVLVHRLMYEQEVGPIPEGLQLDHLCRVKWCLNPAHLEPVTHAENTRRANAKLNEDAVRVIRDTDARPEDLAVMFGVTTECIYHVLNRKTWKHLP